MPDATTTKEAAPPGPAALVEKVGTLSGGKVTGPPWEKAEPIYDEILGGGAEALVEIIRLLKPVDKGEDWHARYVLRGLAAYTARPGKEREHALVVGTLVAQLAADLPKPVKGFLIQELEACGGQRVVAAIAPFVLDDEIGQFAVLALVAIGAAEPLRRALPKAEGAHRTAVVQALGALKDRTALADIRKAVADKDRDTRIAAAWALANLADAEAVDLVIKATDAEGWERIQAVKAALVLAENLLAAGKKTEAKRICDHLQKACADESESYVRDAAARLLAPREA